MTENDPAGTSSAGPEITPDELAARLGTDRAPFLLDVREPSEFDAWAIPGARNLPLGELATGVAELGDKAEVVVVCASGARSARATTALRAAGIPARNLTGGMAAWAGVYDTATAELGPATVVQLRRRGKGCCSYLVGADGEAFVVDPSLDVDRYQEEAATRGWQISRVFDTHLHADHLSGARLLASATGARLHLSPADPYRFAYEPFHDGEQLTLGETTPFVVTALAAPGHTRGSTVFEVGTQALLSGDTLFVDGIGRPDLADQAEAFARDLYRSLHTKVLTLPGEVLVLPAHYGEAVTVTPGQLVGAPLEKLRRNLPQLDWSEAAFVAWASGRATPRPPHYVDIVRINMGDEPLREGSRQLEVGPNRCAL